VVCSIIGSIKKIKHEGNRWQGYTFLEISNTHIPQDVRKGQAMDTGSWILFGLIGLVSLIVLRLFQTDQQDQRSRPSDKYAGRSGYRYNLSRSRNGTEKEAR